LTNSNDNNHSLISSFRMCIYKSLKKKPLEREARPGFHRRLFGRAEFTPLLGRAQDTAAGTTSVYFQFPMRINGAQ